MASDRYCVMGNPIAHSKSPRIHALFAEQTGQDLRYEAVLVPRDGFRAAVEAFHAQGGKGLNVTVPFKQEAVRVVDTCSDRAAAADAVNTIVLHADGTRFGDNTDGVGLVRDLRDNHGIDLAGRRVLLLGAGGAVRGVLGPLLDEAPAALTIANRTAEKAVELARRFGRGVNGCGFDQLQGRYDVIINGTSASLAGQVPPVPEDTVQGASVCYDMMYGPEPTAFVAWARARGVGTAVDGLGMLVEQAAESFRLWRGVRPDTGPVLARLRREMAP